MIVKLSSGVTSSFTVTVRLSPTASSSGRPAFENVHRACLYTVVRWLDPTGSGQETLDEPLEAALNAFAITFEGRLF